MSFINVKFVDGRNKETVTASVRDVADPPWIAITSESPALSSRKMLSVAAEVLPAASMKHAVTVFCPTNASDTGTDVVGV
jgi:hypothetical protein